MAGGDSGKATYYAVLGVDPDASAAEIRSACLWLRGPADHPRLNEKALARYHEIQEAYKELSDPSRKAMYDAALLLQRRFQPFHDAHDGRDKEPLGASSDIVDELADEFDKVEIKGSSSSSSSSSSARRTGGRPASGRIDLVFFTFTTDDDAGTSRGGAAGPRNAARGAGSSSAALRRRAAPRSTALRKLMEASRLRGDRKD